MTTQMKNILISGGTGLIGKELSKALQQQGFNVAHLSRSKAGVDDVKTYLWDIEKKFIEPEAFDNVNVIIHLAGSGIADARWTKSRKKEILNSRVDSCNLLFDYVKKKNIKLDAFISASGTGYYGAITTTHVFTENDPPANDFLGQTCVLWEKAADNFLSLNTRVVKIRTGIVLSKRGGALEKMAAPVKCYLGASLGNGKQFMPWIHISDLVNIYLKAVNDTAMHGAYNAVAPESTTNDNFNKKIAECLKKPLLLPPVPALIMKIALGEMAKLVLEGSAVSSEKIQNSGFVFQFANLKESLKDLF